MKRLALALTLAACTPDTARPTEFPDGRQGFALVCDSAEECVHDAHEACGGRYDIVHTEGADELVTTSSGSATRIGDVTLGSSETRTRKERFVRLLVKCRR